MRKTIVTFCLLLFVVAAFAKYEPNTKWPYLYENFTQGVIYSTDKQKSEAELNVHLSGNVLHYIGKDGRVYQSDSKGIARVEIGSDAYIFNDGKLMQIIANEGTNLLLKLQKGDFDRMQSGSGGAYGSDLNSSASKSLTSLELGGMNTPEHGKMLQEKNDGSYIPMSTVYYFVIDGKTIEATKSSVFDYVGKDKEDALKQFVKENKIKWKNTESLEKVLEYLSK